MLNRGFMKCLLFLWACLIGSSALAENVPLTLTPAKNLERGLTVVERQRLELRIKPEIKELQTATVNITRGGRVQGEYAMRKIGDEWVANFALELPYAHILTVRLYEDKRVWAAAADLTALEAADAQLVSTNSSANANLEFSVTEGKPGGDANPWWGIAALAVLGVIVYFITRGRRTEEGKKKKEEVSPHGS
jgi:hypothetical protein